MRGGGGHEQGGLGTFVLCPEPLWRLVTQGGAGDDFTATREYPDRDFWMGGLGGEVVGGVLPIRLASFAHPG
jgi:hypothetical protein